MENSTFSASQLKTLRQSGENLWTPEADHAPTKTDIFCSALDATGSGFALALAEKHGSARPWLWVQDERSRKRSGLPCIHGLPEGLRHECRYISATSIEDALFSLEEGLKCASLSFVIGEIAGNPTALGFVQSRRLAVASERYGVPLYLLRSDAARSLSAARMRWAVEPAVSQVRNNNCMAPGAAAWGAELFRSRLYQPSQWQLAHDRNVLSISKEANRIDLASVSSDRPLAAAR